MRRVPNLPTRRLVPELNGALADLGTLLPLGLGVIGLAGLAPFPVIGGFAIFYLATAACYRLPIPVQPMKVVAAVVLTQQIAPAALATSGLVMGATLILLGATRWIDRLARLVPQSVLAGLQLGLGVALAGVSLSLMASAPMLAVVTASVVAGLALLAPGVPAVLVALVVATPLGLLLGAPGIELPMPASDTTSALPLWPSAADLDQALTQLALPQLPLTLTNAVLVTALLARDYFGVDAAHVTPRRLAMTSGIANLVLVPLGALPMCHGSGGLAAHHRFGARTGLAPLALGSALLALALAPHAVGVAVLGLVPVAGLGALMLFAAGELAFTRRLRDCRPSCRPVIAVAAVVTVTVDPFAGLVAGTGAELLRVAVVRRLRAGAEH